MTLPPTATNSSWRTFPKMENGYGMVGGGHVPAASHAEQLDQRF
jgi:hypothetical protein